VSLAEGAGGGDGVGCGHRGVTLPARKAPDKSGPIRFAKVLPCGLPEKIRTQINVPFPREGHEERWDKWVGAAVDAVKVLQAEML
jgi:hypothetical protein